MDKFIIRGNEENQEFSLDDNLFYLIESKTLGVNNTMRNDDNKIDRWKMMIKEWNISKYCDESQILTECECEMISTICVSNGEHKLMICDKCMNQFPELNKIYDNIDKIVNAIMNDKSFYQINSALIEFLNLNYNTVDKYNKNGMKNKRNIKIYNILFQIGEYHYKNQEFKKKLNSIYTKISRTVDVNEIIEKIQECLLKIKFCNKCSPLNQCLTCFKKHNHHLTKENNAGGITNEQMKVLWKVLRHIMNDEKLKYGLYGSAGTGKTTLIKYILQIKDLKDMFILKELRDVFGLNYHNISAYQIEKLLDSFHDDNHNKNHNLKKHINGLLVDILQGEKLIVLASPTNKALDVIREKVCSLDDFVLSDNFTGHLNNLKIIFFTISKLLTYRRFMDLDHHMFFKRGVKYVNIIDKYNLVIIDESSMINKDNVIDIRHDIENRQKFQELDKHVKGFILFTGDKAQLPPPKENFSAVFKLNMNKTELETVMRTNKQRIVDLSNFIRKWLFEDRDNVREELLSHKCEYIEFYMDKEKFIDQFCKTTDAIILVWTNKTRDTYNAKIREKLFGKTTKRFMIGEHLIFDNFYKIKTQSNDEKVFYSSMPIIVRDIKIDNTFMCDKFDETQILEKINEKMRDDTSLIELYQDSTYKKLEEYIKKFVHMFNTSMNHIFKVWVLYFIFKGQVEEYPINVIYHQKLYTRNIEQGKRYIKEYFDQSNSFISNEARDSIREIIVEIFDKNYVGVFCSCSYSYSLTTDKSQGSTYEHIFVDCPDMLDQRKYPFMNITTAKQRFYTAITRASHELSILI